MRCAAITPHEINGHLFTCQSAPIDLHKKTCSCSYFVHKAICIHLTAVMLQERVKFEGLQPLEEKRGFICRRRRQRTKRGDEFDERDELLNASVGQANDEELSVDEPAEELAVEEPAVVPPIVLRRSGRSTTAVSTRSTELSTKKTTTKQKKYGGKVGRPPPKFTRLC